MGTAHTIDFIEDEEFVNLFSKRPETIKPGLERIRPAWSKLGMNHYPQLNILIGGTNGKGSTAGFLWHLLAAHGVKAGLFTSPHLCLFQERFQCTHEPIRQSDLKRSLNELRESLEENLYAELSFFEVSTLLALKIFNERACTVNILEVGLGGRLDSTNIVNPSISVVCSIDLDHTEWLGSTLTDIAEEKLGICRKEVPLFWGEQQTEEKGLLNTLSETQKKLGMPIYTRNMHFGLDLKSQKAWTKFGESSNKTKIPIWVQNSSDVIKQNFALAYGVYSFIKQETKVLSPLREINPIACFSSPDLPWPPSLVGRFQELKVNKHIGDSFNIFLDVCHNPAAAREFVATFKKREHTDKIPGFVSILNDKDIVQILNILREVLEPIYFFKVRSERTNLDSSKGHFVNESFSVFADLKSAWMEGKKLNQYNNYAICGSFFAVADALKLFSAYPEDGYFTSSLQGIWTDNLEDLNFQFK
ncbi:MAG: folylpolyglutamate synthase/dihydrofolate synthase family protein [Oligoflexales bacterium]